MTTVRQDVREIGNRKKFTAPRHNQASGPYYIALGSHGGWSLTAMSLRAYAGGKSSAWMLAEAAQHAAKIEAAKSALCDAFVAHGFARQEGSNQWLREDEPGVYFFLPAAHSDGTLRIVGMRGEIEIAYIIHDHAAVRRVLDALAVDGAI